MTYPAPSDPVSLLTRADGTTEPHSRDHGRIIEAWENVKHWGAKGDGTTDDTAAVQAAIDESGTAGGTVYFPPGTYKVTGVSVSSDGTTFRGAGKYESTLQVTTGGGALVTLGTTQLLYRFAAYDMSFKATGTGGHVFTSAYGITECYWVNCGLWSETTNSSLWYYAPGIVKNWTDNMFLGCNFTVGVGNGAHGFDLRGYGDVNSNSWIRCRWDMGYSSVYAVYIECLETATYAANNTFQDQSVENANGGFAKILSGFGTVFDRVNFYDLTTTTNDLIYLGKTAGGPPCRYTTLRVVTRNGGTLGGGLYDVNMQASGSAFGLLDSCTSITLSGFKVNFNSNTSWTVLNCHHVTFSGTHALTAFVGPTTNTFYNFATDPTATGGSTVGFYGATPTAKQTGVAVTTAGVHAALVNLGLISA